MPDPGLPALPVQGLGAAAIGPEEEAMVLEVLRRGDLFRYYGRDPEKPPPMVAALEDEFRAWLGMEFALAVSSGTAALEVSLAAMGIGPGDEVIVPAWSWLSCFTAVIRVGARPVLAEIDETLCLDPAEIGRLTTARTRAVLVVHYQGAAAAMDSIVHEAHRRGLFVLEDVAEAPGAFFRGRRLGTWGDAATFSFQHNKPMTAGEGGMLATRDARLYERAVRMHDLGQYRAHHQALAPPREAMFAGGQYRMSELTAAVARAQLRKVDAIRAHCQRLRDRILTATGSLAGIRWRHGADPQGEFAFELYFFLPTEELAAGFRRRLEASHVVCQQRTGTYPQYHREYVRNGRAHAPAASPFRDILPWPAAGYRAGDFPRTEALTRRFVALPLGWRYTEADADHIATAVRRVHEQMGLDHPAPAG